MIFIARLIINMVAILIISYLFPKMIWVDGFLAALVAAFLLGIVNAIIRPDLGLFHPPPHRIDFGTLPVGHQWVNALVGSGSGKGISRQWLFGGCIRLHSDQHRELDPLKIFTPLTLE